MANLRPILIMGLLLLAYMMWVEWQKDYAPVTRPEPATSTLSPPAGDLPGANVGVVPEPSQAAPAEDLPLPMAAPASTEAASTQTDSAPDRSYITVRSDVLEIAVDPVGGTVVSAMLLDYPVEQKQPDNLVQLLQPAGDGLFIAQSGLLSQGKAPNHTSVYQSSRTEYTLSGGSDRLEIPLVWESGDGLRVTKTLVLRPGRYEIDVNYRVENNTGASWTGSRYDQLQRSIPGDQESAGFTHPERYSFFGIGFYNPEDKFEKIAFDDVAQERYQVTTRAGWLAMIQHYFFAAWIPPADEEATYTTQAITGQGWPRYIARNVSPARQVPAGGVAEFSSRLYLGPKLQDEIPDIAPGLEYTVNYGIFTVFSKPLFWLLEKIHDVVGNWGWAIVILTILIKAAFFKLTEAQYRSTARMRKLQPRIEQLKERYGDDRQRMSQAMMEMYKKEKVNPLGGCLPILVQIPIFIALYWVLLESVELRQAPFILWIDNLSVRDPYFVLPLLNAAFMFATQRLTPMVGMDPLQQKLMTMMPIVFSIMFAFFPAGLVLYWATNAGLSLAQQYYITRKIAAAD
jgi:YidC/Oxa1 family membrane protein insertase